MIRFLLLLSFPLGTALVGTNQVRANPNQLPTDVKNRTKELESSDFHLCIKKTATEIQNRTLRIHYFQDEKRCFLFYSVKGKDELIAQGKWLRFCKKKLEQTIKNLEKGLWECKNNSKVKVLYSL